MHRNNFLRTPCKISVGLRTPCLSLRRSFSETSEGTKESETLPFLPRPLGVRERPNTLVKTWADTRDELMDQEKRMEKRRHIVKEASKGYFSDFNALRKFGGKTWVAPHRLIREDQALYFPDVAGTALEPRNKRHTTDICAGRVSVISMLTTQISEHHTKSFVETSNSTFLEKHPLYQYVQINLQENPLKGFLVNMFLANLRRSVPPYLHPTYLVSSQNMEYQREPLGMVNKHIGYVYLVDANLKVRWAGCGFARPEESVGLQNCVRVLLDRTAKT